MREEGPVNLSDYDFNLAIWQNAFHQGNGTFEPNYKIPARIGRWEARMRSHNFDLSEPTIQEIEVVS